MADEIPQSWMPEGMPDEQKDEIAAKHPDDPYAAAAEAWATWANEMPIEEQGVKSISTGSQSITYEGGGPYDAAMDRARWYKSRSKTAKALDVGGKYKWGYNRPTRWGLEDEADLGDPPLPNGEPWGAWNIHSSDVILTHGSAPLRAGVLRDRELNTQEDANWTLAEAIEEKADKDHTHEGGSGGGPHKHDDLASKADLNAEAAARQAGDDGKADKNHAHDYSSISNDISAVSDRVDALEADPTTKTYVDEADGAGLTAAKDYTDAAMRVHLEGHGSGSGGGQGYDDTEIKGDIADNTAAIADNTTAIAGKADKAHDHEAYQPKGDYAATGHDHSGYAPTAHEHEYQAKGDYSVVGHDHNGYAPTSHDHGDKADKNHTHDDLIPVPVSYRLETDANTRGLPSIQLVDSDDNYSDVQFHAGEGVEVTSQASALTVSLSEDHLEQVDNNRQNIQLLWAATQDKMEIQTIVSGQWMFAGENKLSPRSGEFSMDSWYFNQVSQIFIGQKNFKRAEDPDAVDPDGGDETAEDKPFVSTWADVRVNDEIHVVDATQYDGDPVLEKDRYQGKYIITNIIDNSGAMLLCDVELVHAVGTIRDNKQCSIKIRGARVPDHTGRIDDQQKQIDDLIEMLDNLAADQVAMSYGKEFKNDSGYFQYAGIADIGAGKFCWDGKRSEIYISAEDAYGAKWRHMTHGDKTLPTQVGTIYEIGEAKQPVKFFSQFTFDIINVSSKVVTIKNVSVIFNTGSSIKNNNYIINFGGAM